MSDDSLAAVAQTAAAAAGAGAAARVAIAAHGGARGLRLGLEAFVGAALGIIAAAAALWFDPSLRDSGWPIFITAGCAGLAGALGTRGLDVVIERLGRVR